MKPKQTFTLLEARQELAKQSNQRFWDLLETSNRTSTEDEELLLAAYASIYLWKEVGTAVHTQRGYWLVARAYISLQQADDAISWAEKCLKITEKNPEEMEDFDLAYAQESLARAYALAGMLDQAQRHRAEAERLGEQIEDAEDRKIFWGDFQGGDWYQLHSE
jgi:tetratricopeptide (TPR) repeat protein